jgi:molybdate-binding protein
MERALGHPLVIMERGRGAHLSPIAERLIEADAAVANVLGRELAATLQVLNREAAASPPRPGERPLVVHASHDLALAELRDLLARTKSAVLDLHFRGSLDCLASLARSECDLAGFHLPEPSAESAAFAPYRPLLGTRGLRLVRFVHRSQGLMVPRGNPKRLRSLADLVEKGARFVNRQPESGTRLCFDRLLAAAGLRPAQVKGYQVEEFTHAAVAATVASGMADAGFGIEAAARQQGLDFLPLAAERYYLALRDATLSRPATTALLDALLSREFQRRVRKLPGYDMTGIGEILTVRDAFGQR